MILWASPGMPVSQISERTIVRYVGYAGGVMYGDLCVHSLLCSITQTKTPMTPLLLRRYIIRLAIIIVSSLLTAVIQFKEISHAYEVLSDPEKREIYNQYGEDGLKDNGAGAFSAEDIFSQFFGGGFFGGMSIFSLFYTYIIFPSLYWHILF